jgi:hypothetical protein
VTERCACRSTRRRSRRVSRFTRFVLAQARAKGNIMQAFEIAKANEQWRAETPEVALAIEAVMKSGIPAMGTGDNGNMLVNYQVLQDQFIEYLRPLTIIGRLPGLTGCRSTSRSAGRPAARR